MTDDPTLNWAAIALSLFNTILLAWLGLTVLLNADRRAWGIWLASGGLLLGAAFFISHTAILDLGFAFLSLSMIFWWTVGLVPAIVLPFAWYVTMLWYAGYWTHKRLRPSALQRRQQPWLALTGLLLALGLLGLGSGVLLLLTPPAALAPLRQLMRWSVFGVPLLAAGYSGYAVLCIGLALDALRRPGPSLRVMGQLARQRARPWLAAASLVLLVVSLIVGGVLLWLVQVGRQRSLGELYARVAGSLARLDLIMVALIALAVILIGQAVVSYELFTGRTLPRRGLARQWRWLLLVAAGYGLLVGGIFTLGEPPIYIVLLALLTMTLALALLSWRAFAARVRYLSYLRPFMASQRLYDQLLAPATAPEVDLASPFATLCAEVLGARRAYLAALGPLAPLAGRPLAYPAAPHDGLPPLAGLAAVFPSPETMIVPVDPGQYAGAAWAVPLWSQRGLSGVLLLGDKRDGGLYAEEEIELARISGERLLDSQASAEISIRLMAVQRERLAESQAMDLRTRRLLHDEVLPGLQAALIALDGRPASDRGEAMALLTGVHRQVAALLRQMPSAATAELARLGLVAALQRVVAAEHAESFDQLVWDIDPDAARRAADLPPAAAEIVYYAARELVRNAARHGRGVGLDRPLGLRVAIAWHDGLEVVVEDDGVGLDDRDEPAGGQGLALHSTMLAVVGGTLTLDSAPGRYTRAMISLPEGSGDRQHDLQKATAS